MEKYNIGVSSKITTLKNLIEDGLNLGVDLEDVKRKYKSVVDTINSENIRIALLGSFSDGKTSAIAGLLGRLEKDMKIDEDESSDELKIYRPFDLRDGFEIVDTPGLFGTKEKEIDGKEIKFSDITKQYISEAHIIIYVCDAVNPLKDSHKEIINWVMRDLNKLESSIFVINKMDEAGYDLEDENEYEVGSSIKKQNLVSRLKKTLNLTEEEVKNLHIVCISADPYGRGLNFWFDHEKDYQESSHIDEFRNVIDDVVESCDVTHARNNTAFAAITDMLQVVYSQIDATNKPMKAAIKKLENSCQTLDNEISIKSNELLLEKKELKESIDEYRKSLLSEIKGASIETIQGIIDNSLGIEGGKVTFYVLLNKLNDYVTIVDQGVTNKLKSFNVKFQQEYTAQTEFLKNAAKEGADALRNVKITNNEVIAARDIFSPSKKFKPYEAINMGKSATKVLTGAAAVIEAGLFVYEFWKAWQDSKKLDQAKSGLKDCVDKIFSEIYSTFETDAIFFKNYATGYVQKCDEHEERKKELEEMKMKSESLESYRKKIKEMLLDSVQDVDYNEI